jgi:spore photoproduct lyase
MYCRYCVLQAYFTHSCHIVYDNFNDLTNELKSKLDATKGIVRFGTGEFGDSLYNEHLFGFSTKIADILGSYPNTIIEFKTKSTNIEPLRQIKNPRQIIVGFSMNTEYNISVLEKDTAPLHQRLEAAQKCLDMGFHVAFHFDPMIWYDNWENDYRETVHMIFSYIKDPQKIAWVSMGGFRTMPSLKTLLRSQGTHLPLFSGEMVQGEDGKLRYFRPVRAAFYRAMAEEFDKHYQELTLYLCMESPELWADSGLSTRIPKGLPVYLDKRAEKILTLL